MARITPEFWRDKQVFITGHTGFKGSWISLWLQSLGAIVHGLSLSPPTTPSLFEEAHVEEGMYSIIGDIRSYETVYSAIKSAKPDIIIHLAAQPLVQESYLFPIETYATNVLGTAHILEAARQTGYVKAIVNVTTDKCYENKEWPWGYREIDPVGGHDPYSSSKACAELLTSAYNKSFFQNSSISMASARAGNVIGGGDWTYGRLLPDVLRAFDDNRSVIIRNPDAIRPWQHVLEPLSGYLLLAEKLFSEGQSWSGSWNFGPNDDDAKSVQWIVEKMIKSWGKAASWTLSDENFPHEARYLKLDISKAKSQLGWKPCWSLPEALEQILMWHREWRANSNMREVCLRQIALFSSLTEIE